MWDDIEFLGEFAEVGGIEWGKMIGSLCMIVGRIDVLSDQMTAVLVEEIADNAEYVQACEDRYGYRNIHPHCRGY